MSHYTAFQFLEKIEDSLSEKIFTEAPLSKFTFQKNRLLNFNEKQAKLKLEFTAVEGESKDGEKEESKKEGEESSDGGEIIIQEVPHEGPHSAFQCFINVPNVSLQSPRLMLITDDNLLDREALKMAYFYEYFLKSSVKDKLEESEFEPLSTEALKTKITEKVDSAIPRVEPVKEEPKAEEAVTESDAEKKEEVSAAN